MPTPFASLQTRLNTAEIKHLADKALVINGVEVDGIFGNESVEVNFIETQAPAFSCLMTDVPEIQHGDLAVSGLDVYVIRGIKPDGTGRVTLVLELQ